MNLAPIPLLVLWLLLILPVYADDVTDLIPEEIRYHGRTYAYHPQWKRFETILRGNLDNDPEEEIVVSFGTKQKIRYGRRKGHPAHFCLIYDLTGEGYKLTKTIRGDKFPGKLILEDFDKDGARELAIFTHGRRYYTTLYIYKWKSGEYDTIFKHSGKYGIDVDLASPPTIKIGSPNVRAKVTTRDGKEIEWQYDAESLWEVYQWNGETFIYNKDLSTPPKK
ncbi:MAG: hypothetical protein JSW40_00350 [Candidatus Omnitrophota bacterium]|nr:MAG: hypothetical protein JSW40_00350 [Candidatus Omnitrophota bacterium]